jgi:hypothetical protein
VTKAQRQRIRVVLNEAIAALRTIDPHLDAWNCERSIMTRHLIQLVLRELDKMEDDGDALESKS